MVELENYLNGGSGQPKFVAQLFKDKSGVQPSKTFADTVRGHQVQVRGRNNRGEQQNPVFDQWRLSETPVNLSGPMTLEGRDVGPRHSVMEFNLGETNPVGNKRSFPLNFKSKVKDSVYGKVWELRNAHWTGEGLTIKVNEEGKRHVAWNSFKGGLRTSNWVSRSQKDHMMGPPNGSWVLKNPMIGSTKFRCDAGISYKGGWRNSKWVIRNQEKSVVSPSSGSRDQLCPTLAQTVLGSLQLNKSCFSGPSVFEMGEPSSLTSLITQAHSEIPFISPSDKPEDLRSFFKMPARKALLPLLDCCSGFADINSNHLMVAGIGAGYYFDDLTARPMVGFNNCIKRTSSDSTAVVGLKLGTIYDGLVVASMLSNHFSIGFYSSSFADISFDHLTVARYYSNDLTTTPMVGFNNCIERKSSDSTAVVGLKLGTISDGLVAAPMMSNHFFSSRIYSNSHELVQMGTYGSSPDGFNSNDFMQFLGKTDMVISQLSKGIFLVDILKRLSNAGFGVNRGDKVGSECSVLLFNEADNKGTRRLDMGEIG